MGYVRWMSEWVDESKEFTDISIYTWFPLLCLLEKKGLDSLRLITSGGKVG